MWEHSDSDYGAIFGAHICISLVILCHSMSLNSSKRPAVGGQAFLIFTCLHSFLA